MGRGRHVYGVAGHAAPDPVLRSPEFAGCLSFATCASNQNFVDLTNEPQAQREGAEKGNPVVQGAYVVGDFLNVLGRYTRSHAVLVEQKIGEGGLGTLDLTGEDGLLAYVAVEELIRTRE